ncbi:hypothetical protein DYB30_007727 [Aphanomyces astaci]|uniref:PH domain-containing protein n=1 Tax=Aphanomyces astaci TaxID=112090 RepID=A0A397E4A9_APHAT|nr:hypothetical protein DYB30_007727 [Aphanomyces astaci]
MSKEGYIIRHGKKSSDILYCIVQDGRVIFLDRRGGDVVEEFGLTRTLLKIRGATTDEAFACENSFIVQVRNSQLVKGRQVAEGTEGEYLLSAPSHKERKEWGNAIHSWQRHYWREPLHAGLNMTEIEEEAFFRAQVSTLTRMLQESPRGKQKGNRHRTSSAASSNVAYNTMQQPAKLSLCRDGVLEGNVVRCDSSNRETRVHILACSRNITCDMRLEQDPSGIGTRLLVPCPSSFTRRASNLAHVVIKAEGATPTKSVVVLHGILGNKGNWATFSRRYTTRSNVPSSEHAAPFLHLTLCPQHFLPKLMEVPMPIATKKELVATLEAKGFDIGQAQWMTTNLKPLGDGFVWKMDLPVVALLFKAFLATDCWPILEHPPPNTHIHVVRAELNKFWTRDVIRRFDTVATQTHHRVHLHLLEKADHWVHVDNPQGLFAIMQRSFK